MLVRIVTDYFVAGVVLENNRVRYTAPIVKYMQGWNAGRVRSYAKSKGWLTQIL
jgi:hypothetical protein